MLLKSLALRQLDPSPVLPGDACFRAPGVSGWERTLSAVRILRSVARVTPALELSGEREVLWTLAQTGAAPCPGAKSTQWAAKESMCVGLRDGLL